MTARHWCFTSFEQTDIDEENKHFRYCIQGIEICPKTKRQHMQGYIELKSPVRMSTVKKIIGSESAHLEPRVKSREQARDYCKKEGNFKEYGIWELEQGKRNDLLKVYQNIKDGKKITEIMDSNPSEYIKYSRGIDKMHSLLQKPKVEEKNNYFLYGKSGSGKTRTVYTLHDVNDIYNKPAGKWWDGYTGQKVVLLDDIGRDDYKIVDLLKWLDRYPIQVEIKGGMTYLTPKIIYITSNLTIEELFGNNEHTSALKRRLTTLIQFS